MMFCFLIRIIYEVRKRFSLKKDDRECENFILPDENNLEMYFAVLSPMPCFIFFWFWHVGLYFTFSIIKTKSKYLAEF